MKIDFIISNFGSDGAQRVVCTLANFLAEKGHTIRIITYRSGDAYELHKNIERIRLHKKLRIFDSNLLRGAFNLLKFYREKRNRPDIISSHIGLVGYVTIPIAIIYRIKMVVSEHNNHLAKKMTPKKWFLWHVLYKFPNAVTILTSFDQNYFKRKNRNVVVMPNPLSFKPSYGLDDRNDKTVIAVGNLNRHHHKGFDNLIDIAANILKKHNDWRFKIVGSGEDGYALLTAKVNKYGISDKVQFAGFRRDIQNIFQSSEIFILCSRYEGLPMVLMEAASQGIACISYDCISGPSEIIEDGVNGVLVQDQDIDEMVAKLSALMENGKLRKELGRAAATSMDKFSAEKIGSKWEKLLARIVNSK